MEKFDAQSVIKKITEKIEDKKDCETYRVAKTLWEFIVKKAKNEAAYKHELDRWLSGEESTVYFRDVIAEPFSDCDFQTEMWATFRNAWVALDSWAAPVFQEIRPPLCNEIILGKGTKIRLSYHDDFGGPVFVSESGYKFKVVDDQVYTMNEYGEALYPLPSDSQPKILQTHTYDFNKGIFVKR